MASCAFRLPRPGNSAILSSAREDGRRACEFPLEWPWHTRPDPCLDPFELCWLDRHQDAAPATQRLDLRIQAEAVHRLLHHAYGGHGPHHQSHTCARMPLHVAETCNFRTCKGARNGTVGSCPRHSPAPPVLASGHRGAAWLQNKSLGLFGPTALGSNEDADDRTTVESNTIATLESYS